MPLLYHEVPRGQAEGAERLARILQGHCTISMQWTFMRAVMGRDPYKNAKSRRSPAFGIFIWLSHLDDSFHDFILMCQTVFRRMNAVLEVKVMRHDLRHRNCAGRNGGNRLRP